MSVRQHLARVAAALGELNANVVFVGGATIDLYITDRAAGPPRFTEDVDVIVDVRSRADYHARVERVLGLQGFKPDMRGGAPICRFVRDDITLDAMPLDASVLGFTNRWYEEGFVSAEPVEVEPEILIRVLRAPYLLATKIEAFKGRGEGDFLASADIEDIVRVVDGRPELAAEIRAATSDLQEYLAAEFTSLLEEIGFLDALPGHLLGDAGSQARVGVVTRRIQAMAEG